MGIEAKFPKHNFNFQFTKNFCLKYVKFSFIESLKNYPTVGKEKVGKSCLLSKLFKYFLSFVFSHKGATYGQIQELTEILCNLLKYFAITQKNKAR